MSKTLARWMLFVAAQFCFVQPIAAAATGQLASSPWLQEKLKSADVLIIDASPGKVHAAGHIPGAVNVDVFTYGGRDMSPAEKDWVSAWHSSSNRMAATSRMASIETGVTSKPRWPSAVMKPSLASRLSNSRSVLMLVL